MYGIRLGLKDVHGISDAEIASIVAHRPFASVTDLMRRADVSRPVVEALAHAGAFDHVDDAVAAAPRRTGGAPPAAPAKGGEGPARQQAPRTKPRPRRAEEAAGRRDRLFVAMTADAEREGDQLALPLGEGDPPPGLRDYTAAEVVRAELEVTGMDASRHLLSFYEPLLAELGVVRSRELRQRRGREQVMVAGVKVSSQTPLVRTQRRIIFLTLDDATGPVDVTVFDSVQERCARTVFHGFVLAVWGTLRRTGVGGVSVVAEEVWDIAALAKARREGRLLEAMAGDAPPGISATSGYPPRQGGTGETPRKMWHASGGSAGW